MSRRFGHNVKGGRKREKTDKPIGMVRSSANQFARNRMTQEAIEAAMRRVERDAEIKAQHGPVKVLFKDGKPCA